MIRKEKDSISWLEFELFSSFPDLIHGVFLRPVPKIEKIKELFEVPLILGKQVHAKNVVMVTTAEQNLEACDGLMTQEKQLGLAVYHADCQAAIFYDPVRHVLATVHCGWKGNVQNIYAETIEKMQRESGCDPKDILVGISPSLGPDASQFINYRTELPEHFLPYQFKPLYFDLWAISRNQLLESGILPDHIEIAGLCTYSNPQDFFSYRREKSLAGRHITSAALK